MEQQINCFEWQNHCSDYLDGTLPDMQKRLAEEHLESCTTCSQKLKHYRLILTSIANQTKAILPPQIRKAPLSAALPRIEPSQLSFSTWELIPWYLRTLIQTAGIILAVLLVISSTPKIRTFYEKSFEKSLSDFRENLNLSEARPKDENSGTISAENSFAEAMVANASEHALGVSGVSDEEDDLSGEGDDNVHAGKSELWRFTLKTVSPDELRPQVIQALAALGVSSKTAGMAGMQVPGGIEFDLLLSQSLVGEIKHALQKLAPHATDGTENTPGSENFTWYRVKSKRKVPAGKSQVVIWLSQPHYR